MTPFKTNELFCVNCNNPFIKRREKERIETYGIPRGSTKTETPPCSKIIITINGEGILRYGRGKGTVLYAGSLVLLPIGSSYDITATTEMSILEFDIDELFRLLDLQVYMTGTTGKTKGKSSPYVIGVNDKLWLYITNTVDFIKDGLGCRCYQEMKVRELFHILRVYYPAPVLGKFFGPMFSRVPLFSLLVYDKWDKIDSLEELAAMAGLSLSGFSKKFRKLFGKSAYQWIMDKKGERIIHELWSGDKSIKQLTDENGFYSVQHFGFYCKKRFGCSPGKIRQMAKNKANLGYVYK